MNNDFFFFVVSNKSTQWAHRAKFSLRALNFFQQECQEESQIQLAHHQHKVTQYFNSKVAKMKFELGDLVLRRVFFTNKYLQGGYYYQIGKDLIRQWEFN